MIKQTELNHSQAPSLIDEKEALRILGNDIPLLEVLQRAYLPRKKYFQNKVRIHILDNIKNGNCAEDCGYCAQRKNSDSGIQNYGLKSEEEIFQDAKQAKENGAYRFCMVTSGTGPSKAMTERLAGLISKITNELGLKVCLSAGLLDEEKARLLSDAGLDRYNHNLNTSSKHYSEICTTHTYQDRLKTMEYMHKEGVGLCSGLIVGMGESLEDLVEVAFTLKSLKVISIPVNFFIPVANHAIKNPSSLTPEFCLRVLSMFRLVNPDSEIRVAAGREGHLRSLQALALYPANSLFASGYLNVKGSDINQTIAMIYDAGFEPELEDSSIMNELNNTEHPYDSSNFPNLYKFPNLK
ncbi:MAG: biotin synthase BioB [Leptospiraceae bacterium]|nr:biotin synthase BioB [Leptospiraceae bacterium]